MALLKVTLEGGSAVMGKYLRRSESGYLPNPKVYVKIDNKVVGASDKVLKTRDPLWQEEFTCKDLPDTVAPATKMRFVVVHANNYGGEERVVGYVDADVGDATAAKPKELKLRSEENDEEHGGTITVGWMFTPGAPKAAAPPAAAAPAEETKAPEPKKEEKETVAAKAPEPEKKEPPKDVEKEKEKEPAPTPKPAASAEQPKPVTAEPPPAAVAAAAAAPPKAPEAAPPAAAAGPAVAPPAAAQPTPEAALSPPPSASINPNIAPEGAFPDLFAPPQPSAVEVPRPAAQAAAGKKPPPTVETPATAAAPGKTSPRHVDKKPSFTSLPAESSVRRADSAHSGGAMRRQRSGSIAPRMAQQQSQGPPPGADPRAAGVSADIEVLKTQTFAVPGVVLNSTTIDKQKDVASPRGSPMGERLHASGSTDARALAALFSPAVTPHRLSCVSEDVSGAQAEALRNTRGAVDHFRGTAGIDRKPGRRVSIVGAERKAGERVTLQERVDLLRAEKAKAVAEERYMDAQDLKAALVEMERLLNDPQAAAAAAAAAVAGNGGADSVATTPAVTPRRGSLKQKKDLVQGDKIRVTRRLELASGKILDIGDRGEVVQVPGKPAVVQFQSAGVCFACERADVEPIATPSTAPPPGIPSAAAVAVAAQKAVEAAKTIPAFSVGCAVRTTRVIEFEGGKALEKNALGMCVKVPGSLAIVKVNDTAFSVEEGDVEFDDPEAPAGDAAAAAAAAGSKPRVSIGPTTYAGDAIPGVSFPSGSTGAGGGVPWVEIPSNVTLNDRSVLEPEVVSRGPVVDVGGRGAGRSASTAGLSLGVHSFHVTIVPAGGSAEFVLKQASSQDTIFRLKKLIAAVNRIPPGNQCLSQELVNGGVCLLDDRRTLASYDIRSGDRLLLSVPTGTVPITFRLPNGKSLKASGVRSEDTILALKRRVHEAANIPISRQRLLLGGSGEELQDRKSVHLSGVVAGAEIYVEEREALARGSGMRGAAAAAVNASMRTTGGSKPLRLSVKDHTPSRTSREYGRALPLHCSSDDSVATATRWLASRLGVPPLQLELTLQGRPLRDGIRMKDVVSHGDLSGLAIGYKSTGGFHEDVALRHRVNEMGHAVEALQERNMALQNTLNNTLAQTKHAHYATPALASSRGRGAASPPAGGFRRSLSAHRTSQPPSQMRGGSASARGGGYSAASAARRVASPIVGRAHASPASALRALSPSAGVGRPLSTRNLSPPRRIH